MPNISVAISGQIVECWVCSSLTSPTGGGGRRVTVHRTKGQLQITQSEARQSTSRCTPGPPRPLSARALLRPLHQSIGNPYPTATVVNDGFYITPGLYISWFVALMKTITESHSRESRQWHSRSLAFCTIFFNYVVHWR